MLEHFLWISQEESFVVLEDKNEDIKDELADVLAYLLAFADVAEIDLTSALESKMAKNRAKYPLEKAHSNATKYTDL